MPSMQFSIIPMKQASSPQERAWLAEGLPYVLRCSSPSLPMTSSAHASIGELERCANSLANAVTNATIVVSKLVSQI